MRKPSALLIALVFGWLALIPFRSSAQASPVFIDDFSVTRNGVLIFDDPFSDGVPPPSAPNFTNGVPASYFVLGTLNESGGRVRLDTVGAEIRPGVASAQNFFVESVLLLTNIDPANLVLGLKNDDTFSVRGLFDLAVPSQNLEFYGVRLTDVTLAPGNDLLHVGVRRGSDGIDRVQFFRLDQVANSFTLFGSSLLDPAHDQILLDLTRASALSDAITASFAFVDGGVAGPFTTFGTSADIFRGENFTRAQFAFFTPVPEPASLILFGVGLVALAAGSWKRSRRH